MKLFIILKDIAESGGGERVCVNLSNAFSEIGFEVSVISFFRFQDEIPFTLHKNINVRFLSHTTPKSKNPFKKLFNKSIYRYILSKKVDTIAQQEKPDIVLANDGWYIPKAKLDSIQYIRLWHLNAPKKIDKRKQKIFNLFDTLVVLSSRELNKWQGYHKNVKVIPNFLPFISQKNTDSNQHRIISVGRMDRGDQKGFLRLIDIWEKVQERIKAIYCHTEQSEVSNTESKKDISCLRTQYDKITIQNDSHETTLDSKRLSAEAVCDDFKSCEALSARGLLNINDEARKANSLKRAETATHKKDLGSWKLIIVGDGVMKEQIQAKILEKNLQDTIILKPFTKDIESEYLNASIYAMTSHFEGFGMVLVEASSYALPCIAFDIAAGPSDIIESHTSGYLIEDNDLQDYADKLIDLMSDKDKRESMGLQAKQRVKERFSKEAIMPLWEEVFRA
ncbi:glycosyltransferase family 4 protein [Helicobacter magdeburgensis]|uniref:Glycosyltransferase family 4 protein n=1 Tax=Helicobacter magdeburgensis TaxID=471858 RepID=A0A4U8SY51_9HELI|nr:glycosyltransferase family 4 protein [Helicobacter magdeburgensis]TLD91763.1 glycosyltransferase family 4 protein [Helicobacter magdeburgensis]